MIRLGRTHGNLLVETRPLNYKLRSRSNRILRAIAGTTEQEAHSLLETVSGDLKTAIVCSLQMVPQQEARLLLLKHSGKIQSVLGRNPIPLNKFDYLIGIDGGGTKTHALICDLEGRTLAEGFAGPSNMQSVGISKATHALEEAVRQAFGKLGQPQGKVRYACLGLAGITRAEDEKLILEWAERFQLADRTRVCNDADILLACGDRPNRIAVIAGTGSAVLAEDVRGNRIHVGGWGPILGDEGSAYHIAISALRLILERQDQGRKLSFFQESILKEMGLTEPSQIISAIHRQGWDKRKISDLAGAILRFAESDPDAFLIAKRCSNCLVDQIVAIRARMKMDGKQSQLLMTGGLLEKSDVYRGMLLDELTGLGQLGDQALLISNATKGAVRLAREMLVV
jgi:N-acetylglucosamine kinase-like BadF-type ATPase